MGKAYGQSKSSGVDGGGRRNEVLIKSKEVLVQENINVIQTMPVRTRCCSSKGCCTKAGVRGDDTRVTGLVAWGAHYSLERQQVHAVRHWER